MIKIDKKLDELKRSTPHVKPTRARSMQSAGALLVDVRDHHELAEHGRPVNSLHVPRGFLELVIADHAPDAETPLILMCGSGVRSLLATDTLRALGYERVHNLEGGFEAWREADLPVEPAAGLGDRDRARYARHLSIPDVGETGQARLLAASVLIIGAGGLGSPAALYLAAAGVGRIGIIDDDTIERSNLQRQILHADHLVGQSKTASAAARLNALNPDIRVEPHPARLTPENVESCFAPYDVIVDGADNFPTRYLANDACLRLGKPLVYGAVFRFSGQVGVFSGRPGDGPCYRCLFPEPPPSAEAPSCAEAGVLGVVPGVIGCLQAAETIKLILSLGDPLAGRLLNYDALAGRFRESRLERDPECAWCDPERERQGYVDYEAFCG